MTSRARGNNAKGAARSVLRRLWEAINTEEGHYRSGLAWLYRDRYEEFEKKPQKKPRDR